MGDLEIMAREFAPVIVLERADKEVSLEKLAESEVSVALKGVREGLDLIISDNEREDLEPVVEQGIDPNVYGNASYGVSVGYGGVNAQGYYVGSGDSVVREDYRAELQAEHELYGEAQDINREVLEASMSGRHPTEVQTDVVLKHVKESMKVRSLTEFQFMFGKLNWDFF